jgi:hypothetical protein
MLPFLKVQSVFCEVETILFNIIPINVAISKVQSVFCEVETIFFNIIPINVAISKGSERFLRGINYFL